MGQGGATLASPRPRDTSRSPTCPGIFRVNLVLELFRYTRVLPPELALCRLSSWPPTIQRLSLSPAPCGGKLSARSLQRLSVEARATLSSPDYPTPYFAVPAPRGHIIKVAGGHQGRLRTSFTPHYTVTETIPFANMEYAQSFGPGPTHSHVRASLDPGRGLAPRLDRVGLLSFPHTQQHRPRPLRLAPRVLLFDAAGPQRRLLSLASGNETPELRASSRAGHEGLVERAWQRAPTPAPALAQRVGGWGPPSAGDETEQQRTEGGQQRDPRRRRNVGGHW